MDVTLRLRLNQAHVFKFFYKSRDVDTGVSTPINIALYTSSFAAMSGKLVDVAVGGISVTQDDATGCVIVTIPSSSVPDFLSDNIRFFQVRLAGPEDIVVASGRVKVVV